MTAREEIRAKPEEVQTMIRVRMTQLLLDHNEPTKEEYETVGRAALDWWAGIMADAQTVLAVNEIEIAQKMITMLRKQEVWGKILRGDAN